MAKKIMIIDDEEDMRIYLETLFKKAGYKTDIAVNGEQALERLDKIRPDLITLDILMPKKSGLKFFKAMREAEKTSGLPVIVISGVSGNDEFFDQNTLGGPTIFLEKPINPETLVTQVRELLGE
jgi:DNA-binding response OmpR family regulator